MNVRRFLPICLTAIVFVAPLRESAAAPLPSALRQTTNGESIRPTVAQAVESGVEKLKGTDPAAQAEARSDLIANVTTSPEAPTQPSAAFLNVYADAVNTELLKLANHENARVRMNAALVAAKVAEKANNARLIPTVVDLLDDENEGVINWALKASKFLIGPAHAPGAGPQAPKLMPAFIAAAEKHVSSGPMIHIAYDSLRGVETGNAPAPAIKAAVDAAHVLLQDRRVLYIKGVPEFAASESSIVAFLSGSKIWRAQTPAQQLTTIQLFSDMISLVAQRFAVVGAIERAEMGTMLKNLGGALTVIGQWTDTTAKMEPFAKPLLQIAPITPGEKAVANAEAAYKGLLTYPQWKDLKPPPKIEK
jgi:hypothetical protein